MIRINLLGQERPKTAGPSIPLEGSLRVALFLGCIILALIVLFVMYHQKQTELAAINAHISNLQIERARLQHTKTEVEMYEKEKTVLQQRIDVIETLQANRTGGQQLLQMVANTVDHSESLWLTSLDRKGNSLNLTGEAASINAVANFITQMKRSGYFDQIEMKETAENDIVKGAQTFGFTMTADVVQPKIGDTSMTAPPPARRPGRT